MAEIYTKSDSMLSDAVRQGREALRKKVTEDSVRSSLSPYMQFVRQYQEAEKRKRQEQEKMRQALAVLRPENDPISQKIKSMQRKPTYGELPETLMGGFDKQSLVRQNFNKTLNEELAKNPAVNFGLGAWDGALSAAQGINNATADYFLTVPNIAAHLLGDTKVGGYARDLVNGLTDLSRGASRELEKAKVDPKQSTLGLSRELGYWGSLPLLVVATGGTGAVSKPLQWLTRPVSKTVYSTRLGKAGVNLVDKAVVKPMLANHPKLYKGLEWMYLRPNNRLLHSLPAADIAATAVLDPWGDNKLAGETLNYASALAGPTVWADRYYRKHSGINEGLGNTAAKVMLNHTAGRPMESEFGYFNPIAKAYPEFVNWWHEPTDIEQLKSLATDVGKWVSDHKYPLMSLYPQLKMGKHLIATDLGKQVMDDAGVFGTITTLPASMAIHSADDKSKGPGFAAGFGQEANRTYRRHPNAVIGKDGVALYNKVTQNPDVYMRSAKDILDASVKTLPSYDQELLRSAAPLTIPIGGSLLEGFIKAKSKQKNKSDID